MYLCWQELVWDWDASSGGLPVALLPWYHQMVPADRYCQRKNHLLKTKKGLDIDDCESLDRDTLENIQHTLTINRNNRYNLHTNLDCQ